MNLDSVDNYYNNVNLVIIKSKHLDIKFKGVNFVTNDRCY